MNSEIKAEKKVIKSIFSDFWFVIPEYQRSYVWDTDNIQDLLDDLWYAYKNKPNDEYLQLLPELLSLDCWLISGHAILVLTSQMI